MPINPAFRRALPHRRSIRLHTTESSLTHIDEKTNRPKMVNIASKPLTERQATATALVNLTPQIYTLLTQTSSTRPLSPKGDIFTTAQLAAISAAKQTPHLIPLCHSVPLAHVSVDLTLHATPPSIKIMSTATTTAAQTGVEMEALTAASVAALTVYDMCKAGGKGMTITNIQLESKTGGTRGDYERQT